MTSTMQRPDTRRLILEQAARSFAEHGYHATSLARLAEQLDVGKSAILYHFRSKSEILRSLVLPLAEAVTAVVDRYRDSDHDQDAREDLLTDLMAAVITHHSASLAVAGDPQIWRNPALDGRMLSNMAGLVSALSADGGEEARMRANAALGMVFQAASLGQGFAGEPITDAAGSEAAMVIELALEVVGHRSAPGRVQEIMERQRRRTTS